MICPSDDKDTILWSGASDGLFSVKSAYAAVEIRIFGAAVGVLYKITSKIIPPKVALFVWKLVENRVAIKETC